VGALAFSIHIFTACGAGVAPVTLAMSAAAAPCVGAGVVRTSA